MWEKPIAGRDGKWKVTNEEWPDEYFAEKACPGAGYFITKDAVVKLRDAISQVKLIVLSIGYWILIIEYWILQCILEFYAYCWQ